MRRGWVAVVAVIVIIVAVVIIVKTAAKSKPGSGPEITPGSIQPEAYQKAMSGGRPAGGPGPGAGVNPPPGAPAQTGPGGGQ